MEEGRDSGRDNAVVLEKDGTDGFGWRDFIHKGTIHNTILNKPGVISINKMTKFSTNWITLVAPR